MEILQPAVAHWNVFVKPRLIPTSPVQKGGSLTGQRVLRFLRNTLRQRRDTYITTLFDMYGLPADFPGVAVSRRDPVQRATAIEEPLHEEVVQIAECRSDRFLPYIQPYEFEALLFSDTSKLAHERPGWDEELAAARRGAASPEHINDGPSARLERLAGYHEVRHGTARAGRIGLGRIREECRHFAAWLTRLESLSALV